MNEIDVLAEGIEEPEWAPSLADFAGKVLDALGIDGWQMGILLVPGHRIRELNARWRGIDRSTDVLSFAQDEGDGVPAVPGEPRPVGDLVISPEDVRRNAGEWKGTFCDELKRVAVHGILHLTGLDHPGDDYSRGMLLRQESLLAGMKDEGLTGCHELP